jgi:hypothetical protein
MTEAQGEPAGPAPASDQVAEAGLWPTLRWAGFLGSSWTWVIGLLWPALLVRDFGLWGWIAFAVPNVAGAAAFGFVLGRPELSRRVLTHHAAVASRFSEVTIAFHVFAAGWVLWALAGYQAAAAGAAVAVATWLVGYSRSRWLATVGLAAMAISIALLIAWWTGATRLADISLATATTGPGTRLSPRDLLWVSPGLAMGFLLCPYLDLTFHRARQATAAMTGQVAFTLGFGGFFLAMIVFSLLYAVPGTWLFASGQLPADVPPWAIWVLAAQIAVQAGLSTGLHLHEVSEHRGHAGRHRVLALAVAGGALAYWALRPDQPGLWGMSPAETVYRCFILFYGLIFPGYVWLVMIPTRRGVSQGMRIALWLGTTALALPLAFFGFVGEQFPLVPVALGLLVAARAGLLLWPKASPHPAAENTA